MGIFALNSGFTNLNTNSWHHFFIEMNKYFHIAKWKPENYQLLDTDIALLFIDGIHTYDLSIIPKRCKKVAIVKQLTLDSLTILQQCDYIIYLNPYQKQAAISIMELTIPSMACPKHPTLPQVVNVNTENFVFFGGLMTQERTVGLADRIKYMHGSYESDTEFLLFPHYPDSNNEASFKMELSKLEQYTQLKSRVIYVNGNTLTYNALKFRMLTAKYCCLWSNGMPIEMMEDLINEKSSEIVEVGINESSLLAIATSGNSQVIVDEESDYVSFFKCNDSFTYQDFAKLLKRVC